MCAVRTNSIHQVYRTTRLIKTNLGSKHRLGTEDAMAVLREATSNPEVPIRGMKRSKEDING